MRELLDSAVESLLASRQEEAMQILQKVERLIEVQNHPRLVRE